MACTVAPGFPLSTNTVGATVAVTVSTTRAAVLVAQVLGQSANSNAWPLASVASSGLSWTKVTGASTNQSSGSQGVETWWAYSSAALSDHTITATVGSGWTLFSGVMLVWASYDAETVDPIGGANAAAFTAATALSTTIVAESVGNPGLVLAGAMSASTVLTSRSENAPWLIEYQDLGNAKYYAAGAGPVAAQGNVTLGATDSPTQGLVAAVEIRGGYEAVEASAASDEVRMYGPFGPASTAFQRNAFQPAAFQMYGTGGAPVVTYELTDNAAASDAFASARQATLDEQENAAASDVLARSLAGTLTVQDSVAVSEVLALARAAGLTVSDSASASDAVAIARVLGLTLTETGAASDEFALAISTGATYELTDRAAASDALSLERAAALALSDSSAASDSFALAIAQAGAATLSESAGVTDAFAMARSIALNFSEVCAASDRVVGQFGALPRRPYPLVAPWWKRHSRGGRLWSK